MPNPKPNSYASLFRYMGKHRKRFIWINLLHLLNASLNLVPAATVGLFIDVVLTQEPTSVFGLSIEPEWFHARFTQAQMIAAYGIGMLALIVFANLVGVVMWRKMIESVQSILLDLKMDIRAHLNRLSLTYYQREQTGAIMEKSLGDVQRLEMFFRVFFHLSYSSLHLIIAPVLMLGQSWMLFFAVLIPTPLIAYSVWLIQHKLKPMYRQLREKESSAASLIQETVSGIREIKAYTMEDRSNAKYRDVSKSVYDQNIDIVRIFSISHQTQYSTHDIAIVLIAVIGGTLIVGGTGSVTPGIMTSFIALTGHFFNPIRSFVGFFETIQRGIVSWDRIREFLDEEALESDASEGVMLERSNVRGEVRFEHVGFSYRADQPILRDIDFTLPAGKKLGIVGTTGGGKSTLMSLLLRFYEPSSGRILLDGLPIDQLNRRSLRQQVGIVFQDTFLFYGTISENLLFVNPDRSLAEIEAACAAAGILDRIREFPDGFDTMVGERGQRLSGGEKQRFSIARLLLKDPAIIILDEATSALDAATELRVQASFDRLLAGRTGFIIAHRLVTVRKCDQILVLDQGRAAELGSHEALLGKGGIYADLWHGQVRSQE